MVRERDIERWLVGQIKRMGGEAFKFVSPGNDGVPDRMVCMPGGRIYFVELKTEEGGPSKIQTYQIRRFQKLGCDVRIISGREEAERFVQQIKEAQDAATAIHM